MMTATEKVKCAKAVVSAKEALNIATKNYNRSFSFLAAAQADADAKKRIMDGAQAVYNEALTMIGEP